MAASDRSQTNYRGLLVFDPRLDQTSIWTAQSSFSEAGPQVGVPEPQQDTDLVLQSSGAQSASKQLRVRTQVAGFPEPDGARFVWRYQGDANWRGWDVPTIISAWEAVIWNTSGSTGAGTTSVQDPHTISLADGTLVCAYQREASNNETVEVRTRDPDAQTWSNAVTVFTASGIPTFGTHPCLVLLPSGRILLFHLLYSSTDNEVQVRMHYSDDNGTTWTQGQAYCLDSAVDTAGSPPTGTGGDPGRIRAAYGAGQILMMMEYRLHDSAEDNQDVFIQFASANLGSTFETIETWDKTVAGEGARFPEVIYTNNEFQIYYINILATADPTSRRLANAFAPSSDATATILDSRDLGWAVSGTGVRTLTDGDLAICVDDDDVIYMVARAARVQDECVVWRSVDHGLTFVGLGQSGRLTSAEASVWWNLDSNDVHPRDMTVAATRGRLVVMSPADTTTTNDHGLFAWYLGGYSTVTMPGYKSFVTDRDQVSFAYTWVPLILPHSATGGPWGRTTAGSFTNTLESPGVMTVTTSTGQCFWEATPTGTVDEGITVLFELRVNSGGSVATDACSVGIAVGDGGQEHAVRFRFSATQFRVRDLHGAVDIQTVTVDMTVGVQVLASLADDDFSYWYRLSSGSTDNDREWTAGTTSDAVGDKGGSGSMEVEFGHVSSATADSDWILMHYVSDEWNGKGLHDGQSNPADLFGRDYSTEPLAIDDGVRVNAVDGPGVQADSYNIDSRADFEVERVFPHVASSPRRTWRTTEEGQQTLALNFDSDVNGSESMFGNDLAGIGVFGANWRTGELQRRDVASGGSWIKIADIDAAAGRETMEYVRKGASIVPNSPTDKPYLTTNEAKDWILDLGSSSFRRVKWHREGVYDNAYAGPILHLHMAGVDDTEPASGTASLWSPNFVVLTNLLGETGSAYRLVIDAQTTPDGYIETGTIVVGPALLFGMQYSRGRTIETERGFEVVELADRTEERRVFAPDRRVVEFAWTDGVDVGNTFNATPDYIAASDSVGAVPVATRNGTPHEVEAIASMIAGRSAVYLPQVVKSTGSGTDVITLTRRQASMLCTIDSNVRIENTLGDEFGDSTGEVFRVATIRLREVV